MRYLIYRTLARILRHFSGDPADPYARLLTETGLTHGEREALMALRRE